MSLIRKQLHERAAEGSKPVEWGGVGVGAHCTAGGAAQAAFRRGSRAGA